MKNSVLFKSVTVALALSIAGATTATAKTYKHESRFTIKFAGLKVGTAKFNVTFDDATYTMRGVGKSSGIVSWITDASGSVESTGTLKDNQIRPKVHKASMKEDKKKQESLLLAFAGGKVSEIKFDTIKPRKPRVAPRYVPLQTQHMAAVLDPVSSLIVPMSGKDARDGRKVCGRTLPVFDGEMRFDMKLSYKGTKPISTNGYSGHAYVCRMRFVPIAGHKKDQRTVKEMAKNKHMEIWLAPMQGVSVFSPIRIKVGTSWGNFDAVPEYFGGAG